MPFLDTLVMSQIDGHFATMVYRKPTHTDQYLQWDSHHTICDKHSVINTLNHTAKRAFQPMASTKRTTPTRNAT